MTPSSSHCSTLTPNRSSTTSLQRTSESIIEGRVTKRGKIEHYLRAFGPVSVLIVELKLKVWNDKERLDAIAQVIAECDGQYSLLLICLIA